MGGKRRPRSVRGMEQVVRQYMQDCESQEKYPTVTGLALALGFSGREALEQFESMAKESPVGELLARSRSLIEEANVQAVYRRDTSTGAKFILQSSFGYGEKVEREPGPITVRVEGEGG